MLHLETNNNIIGNTKKYNQKQIKMSCVKVNKNSLNFWLIVCIEYTWV